MSEKGPERRSPEEVVQEFMAAKHQEMKETYQDECVKVAVEMAKLFTQHGYRPRLMGVRGKRVDTGFASFNHPLTPKKYEGRVSWNDHVVCELDGTVYDPMVGKPLPREEYLRTVFEEPPEYGFIPDQQLQDRLKK